MSLDSSEAGEGPETDRRPGPRPVLSPSRHWGWAGKAAAGPPRPKSLSFWSRNCKVWALDQTQPLHVSFGLHGVVVLVLLFTLKENAFTAGLSSLPQAPPCLTASHSAPTCLAPEGLGFTTLALQG